MTRTLSIDGVNDSIQTIIELTRNGDEVILEENGEPLLKVTSLAKPHQKPRIAGLGEGKSWMSDDFDDELPDEFWLGEE